jgi:hypothetical protein
MLAFLEVLQFFTARAHGAQERRKEATTSVSSL